jgi:hypothetical protein
MGIFGPVKAIFEGTVGKLIDIAKEPIKEWQVRKTVKAKGAITIAKLEAAAGVAAAKYKYDMAMQGKVSETDWDQQAMKDAEKTWKDEIQFAIIMAPFLLCFIKPELVASGFNAVNVNIPWWWQLAFLGILARNFGLRWLVAPAAKRFGGKK